MRALLMRALLLPLLLGSALAPRAQTLSLDALPRYVAPPAERGPVVPAAVQRWRDEAKQLEHGDGDLPRDPQRAASLYCRAARFGDAEAQFNLAWMLTNSRGIQRDDAQTAHLFAAAAEQIVQFVKLVAPDYKLQPALVLAVMAQESNFNPNALSPKNAQGLMQLIPDTARRFGVRNALDPTQNIRGGMAYLRWLLAHFEGDLRLVLAAYNAGEGAVARYRGVPPYAETRDYVRRITASLGYRYRHPFDAAAAEPSPALALIRGPGRWQ